MEELVTVLNGISKNIEKTWVDYIAIVLPILLSFISIVITLWISYFKKRIKKIEGNFIFDEVIGDYYIIVQNTCERSIVLKDMILKVCYNNEEFLLGEMNNIFKDISKKSGEHYDIKYVHLKADEAIVIRPNNSDYGLFSYYMSGYDIPEEAYNEKVKIIITDTSNKTWSFKTDVRLKDLTSKLEKHSNDIK